MLNRLRSGSKNLFVKGLLILVALSFVAWGIGDMFRSGGSRNIATVGDKTISFEQYNERLQREISRYSQLFGKPLGEGEIAALGLRQQVASQMIQEELLSQRAQELGLTVGKDVVYQRIASTPLFNDESGNFDKNKFIQVLRENGLNENMYVESLKNDMAMGFLVTAFLESEPSSKVISDVLYAAKNEKRVADLLVIPADQVKVVPQASDAELTEYYNQNKLRFSVPEKRNISYITITPAVVQKELEITDEQLREQYDANLQQFANPEQRNVSQYLFDNKEQADEAYQMLKENDGIAQESVELGLVKKAELPVNIGSAVFALDEGEYSLPTQSDLGWHIFYVTEVKEAQVPAFDEVKDSLRQTMQQQQSEDLFYSTINTIEDDVAGGADLKSLSEKYGFVVKQAKDITSSSAKLGEIENANDLVAYGFAANQGELSALTPLPSGEGYVVMVVDAIEEARIKPLDSVRAQVENAWKAQKKQALLKTMAQELAEQVKGGTEISKLASVPGLTFLPQRSFAQPNGEADTEYSESFVRRLFSMAPEETTDAFATKDGGYVIGRLEQVVEVGKARDEDAEGYAAVEQEISENFNNELMDAYLAYLEKVYPVDPNHEMITPSAE